MQQACILFWQPPEKAVCCSLGMLQGCQLNGEDQHAPSNDIDQLMIPHIRVDFRPFYFQ